MLIGNDKFGEVFFNFLSNNTKIFGASQTTCFIIPCEGMTRFRDLVDDMPILGWGVCRSSLTQLVAYVK